MKELVTLGCRTPGKVPGDRQAPVKEEKRSLGLPSLNPPLVQSLDDVQLLGNRVYATPNSALLAVICSITRLRLPISK